MADRRPSWLRVPRRRRTADVAPAAPAAPVAPARRTLVDDAQQEAFERDGYVVIDLVDADQVADLAARYQALEHHHQEASPWVDGFETTLYDPRREYRAQILVDVEAVLGPALDAALADHRIVFANYVVKLPGSAEVPLHADWTFVDEDRYRSATVWCPLVDTSLELDNGPLGVTVGSHERIDFLRVANVPAYDQCVEAVADLPRAVPALRAGQAIVMDNRVVHFSPPNATEATRVAVGCVVAPVEAELRHYWVDEDETLLRFTLDRDFYLAYEIGRPRGTEGVLAVDPVPEGEQLSPTR